MTSVIRTCWRQSRDPKRPDDELVWSTLKRPAEVTIRKQLLLTHDLAAVAALSFAIGHLIALPNVERAILLFFIPPVIAGAFLIANRSDPFLLSACRFFISLIAYAVLIAELTTWAPIPKPQFAGMPLVADRILSYYFVAFGLFLWIICPGYILIHWLRRWWGQRTKGVFATCFLFVAWVSWVGTMGALATAAFIGRDKIL